VGWRCSPTPHLAPLALVSLIRFVRITASHQVKPSLHLRPIPPPPPTPHHLLFPPPPHPRQRKHQTHTHFDHKEGEDTTDAHGKAKEKHSEKKRARLFPPRPPLVEGCSRPSSPPPRHHLDTRRILPAFPRVRHALPVLSARHLHRLLLPPYKRPPPPRLRPWKSFVPSQHRTALLASLALLTGTASHRTQPCATCFFSPRATLPSAPFRPPPRRLSFTLCKRTCVEASFGVYRPPRCSPDSVRRLYSVDCSLVCCAHKKGLAARHAEGVQALALDQMRATGFCFGPRAQARSATHCWPRSLARISVEHRHTPALFSTTPHHF